MPFYIYKHPEYDEYVEVLQKMTDKHEYTDEFGVKWKRVLTSPQVNATKICDPWNKNDFINSTGAQKGTYGDLMDRSQEMSEKRAAENGGVDPLRDKKFKDYAKLRGGIKDPLDPSRQTTFENKHIKVTI